MRALDPPLLAHALESALAAVLGSAFALTRPTGAEAARGAGGAVNASVGSSAPRSRTRECARCGIGSAFALTRPTGAEAARGAGGAVNASVGPSAPRDRPFSPGDHQAVVLQGILAGCPRRERTGDSSRLRSQ